MIISFRHPGLELFFRTGSKKGIQPAHADKLGRMLAAMNIAAVPNDLSLPSYRLHPLKGEMATHWAMSVNGNWRLIFRFIGPNIELVDYQDYH